MSLLAGTWATLDADGVVSEGFVRLRVPTVTSCALYIGLEVATKLEALIMELPTAEIPRGSRMPTGTGFRVQAVPLKPGPHGVTRVLLALVDGRYRDVFLTLADDVALHLSRTTSAPDAYRSFVARIHHWQGFLKKHGASALSLEARRGLFGELHFLRELLAGGGDVGTAVQGWRGCRSAHHDFQYRRWSAEIKTTAAASPRTFHVANVRQLDDSGIERLYLVLKIIEEEAGARESLPELVQAFREMMRGPAVELFEEGLHEAGYLDRHAGLYKEPRYSHRRTRIYLVGEGFPRLLPHAIPNGVENVEHEVSIAACAAFAVDMTDHPSFLIGDMNRDAD